jgi:hypothetical protein
MEPGGSLPHTQEPATCSYPEPAQSSSCTHPTTLTSILILSSHLRLGPPGGRLPSGLLTKILYAPRFSPHTPRLPHSSRFDYPSNIW